MKGEGYLLGCVWFALGNLFQIALRDGGTAWAGFGLCLVGAVGVTAYVRALR